MQYELCNIEKNSFTNLFEHPCTMHIFTKVIVAASLLHQAPRYRGMQAPCNTATLSTSFGSTLPRCSRARSKCGCSISKGSSLGLTSTCVPTSSTISQACYSFSAIVILTLINILGIFCESSSPTGGTSNGSTSSNKHPKFMPLCNCGFMFVSYLAFASQLSSDLFRSLSPFQTLNNRCLP